MVKLEAAAVGLLLLAFSLAAPIAASPDLVKWSRVNLPTQGKAGGWGLALGSDIKHPTMAINGTLYAYKLEGTTHRLMRSTDKGVAWSETDYDGDAIVAITCSSTSAGTVYATDGSHVYQSDDGGDSFEELGSASFPALDANESVTCLDVSHDSNDNPFIFIGTADTDTGDLGSVYYIAGASFGAKWTDFEANYDVYSIAGSPSFGDDYRTVALVTDETHTYIINNYGSPGVWADPAELLENNANSFAVSASSNFCFPADFDQTDALLVGVTAGGNGDVYRVTGSNAHDLGLNANVISLGLAGTRLLAGGTGKVWHSTDDGQSWTLSQKAPTGDGPTYVLMAADFADSGLAYAATSGTGSAFSVSRDGGVTWNQLSLIDTKISEIVDLAPSPGYSQDNTLFMLTYHTGGEHSLWRSQNNGWESVYTSTLADADLIKRVELPPQYDNNNQVVFIAGRSNGNPAIWKSTDNGQSFTCRTVSFPIDAWAVVDNTTLFIGSHDGTSGLVYLTTNSGISFHEGAVAGDQSLNSVALSPSYDEDETLLIGNKDGWVFWSADNGDSFEPLPPDATAKPLSGNITVAFDPEYGDNNTVYAASDTPGEGIYRFIIGKSDAWEAIDSPADSLIGQLRVSAEGTLYAANFKEDGGMERSLNPTYSLGPTFETVTRGLDEGTELVGLWLVEHQLWSIDTAHIKLMTYYDSLTQPVSLTSPADEAPGVGTLVGDTVRNISLDWETLSGADEYQWQLDYDTDFSSIPAGFEGTTKASSAQLPTLEPATTYYWKVRAIKPVLSPWSDKWSFNTSLGTGTKAPILESPEAGASGVSVKPIFQWSAIAGAESYELVVSTRSELDNPTILKTDGYALSSTAWQCNIALDYDTTYYWKVRAVNGDTRSAWSAVSAFSTLSAPPPESASPPEPPQSPQTNTSDWTELTMPMGGIMFLVLMLMMMGMLVTMIVLVIKVSKL